MLQFVLQFLNHLFDKEIAERNSAEAILTVRDRIEDCRVRLGSPVASGIFVAVLNQQRLKGRNEKMRSSDGPVRADASDRPTRGSHAPLHKRLASRGWQLETASRFGAVEESPG